jgi:hypothetical protein
MNLPGAAIVLLLFAAAACSQSGNYESNCTLTCSLADGGTLQDQQRVACCHGQDNPAQPGGQHLPACTADWVNDQTQQLCEARSFFFTSLDGGTTTTVCPASQFRCICTPPTLYPDFEGCG